MRPRNIFEFALNNEQHIAFTDDGVNNKFTVMTVNVPLLAPLTGLAYNFDTNETP